MRDIDRIDKFTNELNRIWKTHFPDWRFGQFMSNLFGQYSYETRRDVFFLEEDDLLNYLHYFCGESDKYGNSKM